jgi:hypothetical protein
VPSARVTSCIASVHRLLRQGVHQVDVHPFEGALRQFDRAPCLVRVVDAAERREMAVIEALHADRQAVHAGVAKAGEAVRFDRAGVGFERDFGARRQRHAGAHGGQQAVERRGRHQAGRAAAEEDAVHAPAPDVRQRMLEVGDQRRDIGRLRVCRRAPRAS